MDARGHQTGIQCMTDSVLIAKNRGSIWRRWEPHIHAPGTVLADNFPKENGWELYLDALEAISPPVRAIGVTDYCITRSYERMKKQKERGRLRQCELLFPNIELRLNTGTVKGNFVNIHLLVSPEGPNHVDEPCLSGYHPHPLYVVCLLGLQARVGAGALRRRSG